MGTTFNLQPATTYLPRAALAKATPAAKGAATAQLRVAWAMLRAIGRLVCRRVPAVATAPAVAISPARARVLEPRGKNV